MRRVTIGAFPAISIEEARQEARFIANLCEKGQDPRKVKGHQEKETQVVTLGHAIVKFFQLKAELAPNTLLKYRTTRIFSAYSRP